MPTAVLYVAEDVNQMAKIDERYIRIFCSITYISKVLCVSINHNIIGLNTDYVLPNTSITS